VLLVCYTLMMVENPDNPPIRANLDEMSPDEQYDVLVRIFGDHGWAGETIAIAMGESAGDVVPVDEGQPVPPPFERNVEVDDTLVASVLDVSRQIVADFILRDPG
jgi:hypothetical protein